MPPTPRLGRLLAAPPLFWLWAFFAGPLIYLLALSFATKGPYGEVEWTLTIENYQRTLEWIFVTIFMHSYWLALLTTLLCLLISIALSWSIATLPRAYRSWTLVVITVPFLMNLITRIYALKSVVSYDGPAVAVGRILFGDGIDPLDLSQNQFLVLYGMVATYLPFMLFPIYVSFEKFDFQQIEAVYDLGGSPRRALLQVLLPQLRPAIASGIVMVFVPTLGEYVIPDLLGGAKVMLSGNLITEEFLKTRDWPFGAALATELIVFMSLVTWIFATWGARRGGQQ
ncbi:MAG: ABC transporter permease [Bdellovibrio sp.]|nr:MAG: ABC transporter permease [Bdellovibrio sp.]